MSFLANEWASESAPVADVYERVILGKLANHANDDGTGAWPSVASMARAALCSDQSVRNKLRELKKRKLIAPGDQQLVSHYPNGKRPVVYDLLISVEWYSEQQLAKVNRERADAGKPPLTEQDRPPITQAPPKKSRSDKGKSNPKRSPKRQAPSDPPITLGSVDNSPTPQSHWGQPLNDIDPHPSMTLTQIRPSEPVHITRPSGARASDKPELGHAAGDGPTTPDGADGQVHEPEEAEPPEQPDASVAGALLTDPKLYDDLVAIDLLPITKEVQRKQYAQLVKAIDTALLRFSKAQVKRYLQIKARDRKGVQWVIRAFTEYADAIKQVHLPHQDDSTGDDELMDELVTRSFAFDDLTSTTPAPPLVEEVRVTRSPAPEPDLSSPVGWLTDDQYATLPPQDRATVRASADGAQLEGVPGQRLAAIRKKTDPTTAA